MMTKSVGNLYGQYELSVVLCITDYIFLDDCTVWLFRFKQGVLFISTMFIIINIILFDLYKFES